MITTQKTTRWGKMAKSKYLIAFTVLSMILLISVINPTYNHSKNLSEQEIEQDFMRSPLVAVDHAPISIYGNLELATFISNEGLSGQGTFASPYIIENYTIDARPDTGIQILNTDDYLIIHFRNATCGLIDEGNRHPFPLTKDEKVIRKVTMNCDLAVAHNGVMYGFDSKLGALSDTQNFIMTILSDKMVRNNIYKNRVLKRLIVEMIGSDNKLTFLNKEGSLLFLGEVVKEKADSGEIYYSNRSYETRVLYCGFSKYKYGGGQSKLLEDSRNERFEENREVKDKEEDGKSEKKEKVRGLYSKVGKGDDDLYYGECENCYSYKNVRPLENYHLLLKFENNEEKIFDVNPYLNLGKFKELKNEELFQTVRVCFDSIEWENHLDLDPELLYQKSIYTVGGHKLGLKN